MNSSELATLGTIALLVVTTVAFVELASWSTGGPWTIVPGIAQGIRGWGIGGAGAQGQEQDPPQFRLAPPAVRDADAAARAPEAGPARAAEIEELWTGPI
jgi:hypothetical protein